MSATCNQQRFVSAQGSKEDKATIDWSLRGQFSMKLIYIHAGLIQLFNLKMKVFPAPLCNQERFLYEIHSFEVPTFVPKDTCFCTFFIESLCLQAKQTATTDINL